MHEVTDYCLTHCMLKSLAELLLTHGAEVNEKDDTGETPLHKASYRVHKDVVELLLAHGADVNAKTKADETPLDLCAKRESSLCDEISSKMSSEYMWNNPHYEIKQYDALIETCELLSQHGGTSKMPISRRVH